MLLAMPLLTFALVLSPAPPPDVGWLEGHWCGENGSVASEEIWSGNAQGLAVGLHKDLVANGQATFEFMRITVDGSRATFRAQPGGGPETAFASSHAERRAIVFENAAHDYPKRVGYRRTGDDTLEAWIDGGEGTEASRWKWQRCRASPRG